jgi:hypothetical protein
MEAAKAQNLAVEPQEKMFIHLGVHIFLSSSRIRNVQATDNFNDIFKIL